MYSEVAWGLASLGSQVQPQVILDPDYLPEYLSVSYDYSCRIFRDTAEREEPISLLLTMHQLVSFILTRAILTYPLEKVTVTSFHEIKGRSSARERITLAIRGTLETSEGGSDPWR